MRRFEATVPPAALTAVAMPLCARALQTVIELVLGTDMKQHITITSQFKSVHKTTIDAAEQQV